MKLKGKTLWSLLLVLTLIMQLFSVSAFADGQVSGNESLVYAIYAKDESGAVTQIPAENEYVLENKSYSITVGDKQLNRSPYDVSMNDLMSSDLRITPPDGWYVAKVWLYGDSESDSVALPLTAANPNSNPATAVVLNHNACIAYVADGWQNIFDDSLVSSFGSLYTLGVYFERLDTADLNAGGSYGAGQTVTTDYGDPSQGFAGWELYYPINGSRVLLGSGETVTPYASFDLSPVYAQVYSVKVQDLTLSEGISLNDAYAQLQLETLNYVGGYSLVDPQMSIDGAPDPLAAGTYSLSVSGRLVADNGKDVDPALVMLSTQVGTLTVEAKESAPDPEPVIDPEPAPQPDPEPAPVPAYVPSARGINVSGSPFTQNTVGGVSLYLDNGTSDFSYDLSVDGVYVEPDWYTVYSDAIVLEDFYLDGVTSGDHSVHLNFSNGDWADATFSVVAPAPVIYTPTVTGSPWALGSADGIRFDFGGDIYEFKSLSIGDSFIGSENYSIDNTAVVLNPAFLNGLSNGDYAIHFDFSDGYADSAFTVKDPDPVEPVVYTVTVSGSPWVRGSSDGIRFTLQNGIDRFTGLSIDSTGIDPAYYVFDADASAILVKSDYLDLLQAIDHSIHFDFSDGYADASFTVEDPAPVVPEVYTITGADASPWQIGSSDGFRFQFDKDLANLTGVTANGNALDADSYSVSGNLVTLTPACLSSLGVGTHSIDFLFSDGYTSAPGSLSIEQPVIDYSMTVSGSPWAKNSTDGVTLQIAGADLSQLLSVEVDGSAVTADNYSIGTDIVLNSSYLQQLSSEAHSVSVKFSNGSADGSFTVTEPVYHHYEIKSVSGTPWTKNTDAVIRIAIDADMSKLSSVEIDGSAAGDYRVEDDAVVLPSSLLQNLSSATHKAVAKFSDGEAETSIEINDPNPVEYTVQVSGSPWKKNTSGRIDFATNADMAKLTSVAVDGNPISSGYSISGSTLSLDATYLEALSVGNHSLKLNFADGYANAAFTVAQADPIEYKIIAVNTSPWVKGSTAGISFKIDADAVKFAYEVFIDNNKIPNAAFATAADRTTVTINTSYLESLQVGKHEISFTFNDGFAKGSFAVEAPAVTPSPTPSPSPVSYGFLEGTNTKWIRGSADGMTLKVDADISKFSFLVQVDGNQVNAANYSVTSGSTVVTMNSAYMNTLASGTHTIVINFNDGAATALFTVEEAPPETTPIPLTITGRNDSKTYDGTAYNLANYGANNQGITASFHLVQNGQWVNQAVNIGNYDIYLDSVTIANSQDKTYKITVIDSNGNVVSNDFKNNSVKIGTLSITGTRAVTVTVKDQSWTYDGQAHQLDQTAYTVTGLDSGDTLNIKLTALDSTGKAVSSLVNAGTYSIKAEYSGGSNPSKYSVTIGNPGTLTINPYKLTLTAESASKAYDGSVLRNSNVKATALVSGHKFRSGDGVKFSVYDAKGNLIKNGPVEVGTYSKKVTEVHIVDANGNEVTANYDITRVDGTLTITASGNNSPKTGDQNNIGLWIGLLLASALAVAAVLIVLRVRSKKQRKGRSQAPTQESRRGKRQ